MVANHTNIYFYFIKNFVIGYFAIFQLLIQVFKRLIVFPEKIFKKCLIIED